MPRKGNVQKREVLPDPIYNSKLVTRLINHMMMDGKRGTSTKIIYGAFDIIKNETGNDPVETFEEAMKNIMPVLEVKARRVGGSNYQVPIEVRRWLNVLHVKSWMPLTTRVLLLRSVKIRTGWLMLTVPSHTTAGRSNHRPALLAV